jgi:hypothetical protein
MKPTIYLPSSLAKLLIAAGAQDVALGHPRVLCRGWRNSELTSLPARIGRSPIHDAG